MDILRQTTLSARPNQNLTRSYPLVNLTILQGEQLYRRPKSLQNGKKENGFNGLWHFSDDTAMERLTQISTLDRVYFLPRKLA